MAQSPGFDMSRVSTGTKVLGGATVLWLIVSFLGWNKACAQAIPGIAGSGGCVTGISGWHGLGFIAGLLALALLAEEVMKVLGVKMGTLPMGPVVLGMSVGVFVFTLLRILIKPGGLPFGIALMAWIGLILSLAVAYGGYMRYQEEGAGAGAPPAAPPPPPPAGGGFTS